MKGNITIMPKIADPSKKTASGVYKSQLEANLRYEKNNTDNIRVRVPKGANDNIKEYQKKMHELHPESAKYKSVNSMVITLLEEEMGTKL